MIRQVNILVILIALSTTLGIENDKFTRTLNSIEELLKTKIKLLNDLDKQFHNKDITMIPFRNIGFNYEAFKEASEILKQHISSTTIMYLILKGLAEEWKPVKNLLTKKIEDIEKMFYQHYNLLCNDKIFLSNDIKKLLKCRYVHHDIPFLKIAPFKEEDIYLEPRVVMFHDVISEEEIDTMKDMSKHMLQGSEVEGVNGSYSSQVRISETTWLIDDDHKHVKNVNRRVEDMTNLALDSAEVLQITRYQVGGKYDVHYDFDIEHKMPLEIGDRIATLMFYLSDVSEGGNTIFIDLNITISPKKGNAIFWYNLRKNGDFNLLTAHSGCPVIAGTKWVANKWLNEIGQEFRRPCTWEEKPKESKYFSTISSFNLINN